MNKLLWIALGLALCLNPALAHEGHAGHDSSEPAVPQAGDRPQRLPDGSVWLPKLAQRRLAVRTVVAEEQETAQTLELSGHVVLDPATGGRIQAIQAGRIEALDDGLPLPGQTVDKGQLLAYLKPSIGQLERAEQTATLAELSAARDLAKQRLQRLRALAESVPRKDIEAAAAELGSLDQRLLALRQGVSGREALRAPSAGVLATVGVVNGQVVEARELLFEIVDPQRLMIEAEAYDAGWAEQIEGASLAGDATPLQFLGGGRALRDGALPLLFRAERPKRSFALGQPVKLIARTRLKIRGVPLPSAAVVRNAANETVVWVHSEAERFIAVPVQVTALDGETLVAQGLVPGQRVVIQAATLLNQIR